MIQPVPIPPVLRSLAVTGCRACGMSIDPFLDLGRQPLADAFPAPDEVDDEPTYPLVVACCPGCTLVQLVTEVPREQMFTADYPFVTGSSQGMAAHFERTARWLQETHVPRDQGFVVEIGSNDGTFLAPLARAGVRHLGVDPAARAAEAAARRGVQTWTDFFDEDSARRIAATHGRADVVYAANTLCHIGDLAGTFEGLDALLTDDAVVVFEDPYLGDVLELGSFDQFYDEHVLMFSATSVAALAQRHGFELADVERLPVHGGEVRYTLAREGARTPTSAVQTLLQQERATGLTSPQRLHRFADDVDARCAHLVAALGDLRERGVSVAGYAATAKSATVLTYAGIGPDLLPVVHDTTPAKQGRLTPGSHIPVEPFPAPRDQPEVYLLLAWNHAEEIMAKERAFTDRGGRWLRYVPTVSLT